MVVGLPARTRFAAHALRERLRPRALGPLRIGVAVAIVVGALLAVWAQWQPQRSADAAQQALAPVGSIEVIAGHMRPAASAIASRWASSAGASPAAPSGSAAAP